MHGAHIVEALERLRPYTLDNGPGARIEFELEYFGAVTTRLVCTIYLKDAVTGRKFGDRMTFNATHHVLQCTDPAASELARRIPDAVDHLIQQIEDHRETQ